MAASNPFASLFNSSLKENEISQNDILEEIFGFTINPDHKSIKRLYLEEVKNVHEKTVLDINLLHYALFERLFMCNENSELADHNDHSHEKKVIIYLYKSFQKVQELRNNINENDGSLIENEIIQNAATAFQPDIYSGQDISGDILHTLMENEVDTIPFFIKAATQVLMEENGNK